MRLWWLFRRRWDAWTEQSVRNRIRDGERTLIENRQSRRHLLEIAALGTMAWLAFLATALADGSARGNAASVVELADAAQRGTFNIGPAQATVSRTFDETLGRDVLRLDYTLPEGTTAGVWAKSLPEELNAADRDVVRIGIHGNAAGLRQVALAVELKGETAVQQILVKPPSNGNLCEESVDWKKIGRLSEVVVLLKPVEAGQTAAGSVSLDVGFARLSLAQRLSTLVGARIAAFLFQEAVFVVRRGWSRCVNEESGDESPHSKGDEETMGRARRDWTPFGSADPLLSPFAPRKPLLSRSERRQMRKAFFGRSLGRVPLSFPLCS